MNAKDQEIISKRARATESSKARVQRLARLGQLKKIQKLIQTKLRGPSIINGREFITCVRASLSKSLEFCLVAYGPRTNQFAFFLLPSLRSICEDLIVLSYLAKMSNTDRNQLISLLIQQGFAARLSAQHKFFERARPDQPIPLPSAPIDTSKIDESVRQIWKRNGWPGLSSSWTPNVRQIAEKNHIDVLTNLYDYIYRLTSEGVHFNPGHLFRTAWGKPTRFSVKNFSPYYVAYARTYGLFLFCCYFELFGRFLRPSKQVSGLVAKLRFDLVGQLRWPEMITFEELNLSPPKRDVSHYMYRYVDAHRRKGQLLRTPDRATTLRYVERLLHSLDQHPEKAERIARAIQPL